MNMLQRAIHRISDALHGDDELMHKEEIKHANRDGRDAVKAQRDLNRWQSEVIHDIRGILDTEPGDTYLIEDTYFPRNHPLNRRRSR
jgi:hypothetical protein